MTCSCPCAVTLAKTVVAPLQHAAMFGRFASDDLRSLLAAGALEAARQWKDARLSVETLRSKSSVSSERTRGAVSPAAWGPCGAACGRPASHQAAPHPPAHFMALRHVTNAALVAGGVPPRPGQRRVCGARGERPLAPHVHCQLPRAPHGDFRGPARQSGGALICCLETRGGERRTAMLLSQKEDSMGRLRLSSGVPAASP